MFNAILWELMKSMTILMGLFCALLIFISIVLTVVSKIFMTLFYPCGTCPKSAPPPKSSAPKPHPTVRR